MLNIRKHRQLLFNITQDIYKSTISYYLGFKGGTMLYFFYGLDRFSVDLDFDLLERKKIDDVYKELKDIFKKYGKIKDEMDKNFTLYFLLDYEKNEKNIKVEVSKRPVNPKDYEWKNLYGIDVQTMKIKDAFANKLVAATQRKGVANRDFYDIYFLIKKGFAFNEKIISEKTGKNPASYLKKILKFLENYNPPRGMVDGLGELLEPERKQWVKKNLKKELISQLDFLADEIQKSEKGK